MIGIREFVHSYDTGDWLTSFTYSDGEVLNHAYDAGWQPTSACNAATPEMCYT